LLDQDVFTAQEAAGDGIDWSAVLVAAIAAGEIGLGLAIARAIVAAHGGRMGAANLMSGRELMWFDLPLAFDAAS